MATNLVRYRIGKHQHWGVVHDDAIAPLDDVYPTTAA